MKRFILLLLIVVPVIALLYFGLQRDAKELPSLLIAKLAPAFSLQTLDGKTVTLESFKGSPLIVNFWASWCYPCLQEHPLLALAPNLFPDEKVQSVGILYQDTKENAQGYIQKYGEAFPVLLDVNSQTAIDYGVGGVPETFFIDREGIIRHKQQGMLTLSTLTESLKKIVDVQKKSLTSAAREIAGELRCPVCRGIPIVDSPSTLALDMMAVINTKLQNGESKEEILKYFEDRYGEWILLKPKAQGLNLALWILPILFFLAGLSWLGLRALQGKRKTGRSPASAD